MWYITSSTKYLKTIRFSKSFLFQFCASRGFFSLFYKCIYHFKRDRTSYVCLFRTLDLGESKSFVKRYNRVLVTYWKRHLRVAFNDLSHQLFHYFCADTLITVFRQNSKGKFRCFGVNMSKPVKQHPYPGTACDLVVNKGVDADVAVVVAIISVVLFKVRVILQGLTAFVQTGCIMEEVFDDEVLWGA